MRDSQWRVVVSDEDDPAWNLAIDEAILRGILDGSSPNTIRVWHCRSAIMIGRGQDLRAETDYRLCSRLGIPVIRRCSGGGAVYVDTGSCNYSVMSSHDLTDDSGSHRDVANMICSGITNVLSRLGLGPRFVPPSSVFVGNRKVSGSAQFLLYEAFLHHGTLLLDTNLAMMQALLRPDPLLAGALRAVPSVPSLVANVSDLLGRRVLFEDLTELVITGITGVLPECSWEWGSIDDSERIAAQSLVESKYTDLKWLWGREKEVAGEGALGPIGPSLRASDM